MGIYITLSMNYWRYHGALIERLGRSYLEVDGKVHCN